MLATLFLGGIFWYRCSGGGRPALVLLTSALSGRPPPPGLKSISCVLLPRRRPRTTTAEERRGREETRSCALTGRRYPHAAGTDGGREAPSTRSVAGVVVFSERAAIGLSSSRGRAHAWRLDKRARRAAARARWKKRRRERIGKMGRERGDVYVTLACSRPRASSGDTTACHGRGRCLSPPFECWEALLVYVSWARAVFTRPGLNVAAL